MSTVAFAADFPPALPPASLRINRPVSESGWYLRGDVGVSVQRFQAFDHFQTNCDVRVAGELDKSCRNRPTMPPSSTSASATR